MKAYCEEGRDEWFNVNEKNEISREGFNSCSPSPSWVVRGVIRYNRTYFEPVSAALDTDGRLLRLKNGRSPYHLVDIDNGTTRVHGNRLSAVVG